MDAICFVVGLSARSLRGEKMRDLVFSGAEGKIPKTASVTLSYITDADEVEGYKQGEKMEFSRTINPAGSSIYRLNGEELTADEYAEALASINVITKARNFLVFQVKLRDMNNTNVLICGAYA
jgi:chromosome segregation ATPase